MSATAPATVPGATGSYWSVVGAQLRKNRVAMYAWAVVRTLVCLAIAAPVIALNVPLVANLDGRWSAPLLEGLFDRFLFAGGVDAFFNLLLVVTPVWALGARTGEWLRPREGRPRRGWFGRFVVPGALLVWYAYLVFGSLTGASSVARVFVLAAAPGAVLLAGLRASVVPSRARGRIRAGLALLIVGTLGLLFGAWRETRPVVDWVGKVETAKAADPDDAPFVLWAPIRFHYDNIGEASSASTARSLAGPGWPNVLGCDSNGRDVAARLLFGARISLTIGLVAVALFVAIGVILGSLGGYYQGKVDLLTMRLVEVMICFPTMFLLLTIVSIFETRSIFLIMAAIGLVGWPGVTRLVRAEFLRQRNLDYVVAAKALGLSEFRIIFGHVLPNCIGPVLVSATFGVASAILTESGLAFLGLGDTTAPSWGQLLNAGRSDHQWHLIVAPGFAIFLVVTVFNLLGEGVRDALDPKLRR